MLTTRSDRHRCLTARCLTASADVRQLKTHDEGEASARWDKAGYVEWHGGDLRFSGDVQPFYDGMAPVIHEADPDMRKAAVGPRGVGNEHFLVRELEHDHRFEGGLRLRLRVCYFLARQLQL